MVTQPSLVVNVLIVIGEGFWVLSEAAQLRQLVKTRNVKGLSAVTTTLNTAGTVGWFTYFALNHLWFPVVTNALIFMLGVAILGFILSNRRQFVRGLIAIAIVGPLTSYVLIVHPAAGGWLGMAYNWMAGTPQLAKIMHKRKVSGLSERALYFALGAMLCVLTYGLIIHSRPLVAGCAQGLVYMALTLTYYYRHRKHD